MGMTNGRTICSKHDEIMSLASEIQFLCQDDINPSDLSSLFSDLQDKAERVDQLASNAKEDGQSMEAGLDEKRERISELEQEKEELEERIRELEEKVEDLERTATLRDYEDMES
jgi:chromosome segregation ATPase